LGLIPSLREGYSSRTGSAANHAIVDELGFSSALLHGATSRGWTVSRKNGPRIDADPRGALHVCLRQCNLTRLSKNRFATAQNGHHMPAALGLPGGPGDPRRFRGLSAPELSRFHRSHRAFASHFAYPWCASFSMLCTRQYSFHCPSTFWRPGKGKRFRLLLNRRLSQAAPTVGNSAGAIRLPCRENARPDSRVRQVFVTYVSDRSRVPLRPTANAPACE